MRFGRPGSESMSGHKVGELDVTVLYICDSSAQSQSQVAFLTFLV